MKICKYANIGVVFAYVFPMFAALASTTMDSMMVDAGAANKARTYANTYEIHACLHIYYSAKSTAPYNIWQCPINWLYFDLQQLGTREEKHMFDMIGF